MGNKRPRIRPEGREVRDAVAFIVLQAGTIQKLVENPISSAILRSEFTEGDTILVDAVDGEIALRKKKQ